MFDACVRPSARATRLVLAALLLGAPPLAAQAPGGAGDDAPPAASADYASRFDELSRLPERAVASGAVRDLTLRRDVATLHFTGGQFYRLSPVGGRTVAVAYKGTGTFTYTPTSPLEQRRMIKVYKTPALSAPITSVVLLFSDSTFAELSRGVTFTGGAADLGDLRGRVRDMINNFSDQESKTPDPDIMAELLNGGTGGLFYAQIARADGDAVMFMADPYVVEGMTLSGRSRRGVLSKGTETVSMERPQTDSTVATSERWSQAEVTRYGIKVSLPRNASGEVKFSAAARLDLSARRPVGPWVAFLLFDKLGIDSARWGDGSPATTFKGKDSPVMWLRLPARLSAGDTTSVTVYYHGDLIDRYADLFFIKSSIAWYPVSLEGRTKATFDLTFNTPASFLFATVGERVDSADAPGRMVCTHWVTAGPIRNASFNLGVFETFATSAPGLPPVTVLYAEQAHRSGLLPRAYAKEEVGRSVLSALEFFQSMFGEVPVKRFYVTEIPYPHGEAFPGLIHLALSTFVATDDNGFDELFRAHEVAHQWWAIGVDFATYHDRWLSEGFANFSGLWYLQAVRKDNKRYFSMLDRWRSDIMLRRDNGDPIALGSRIAESADENDYNAIVYEKGAWVLHMLRILMLDLHTMKEDRFTNGLREFYATYRGRRASTDDFRRVMERHAGARLEWFFDEWFSGTGIPTYKVAWRAEPADGGKFRVKLRVAQEHVPDGFMMYVPVTVDLAGGGVARLRVKVVGPMTEAELPLLPSKPKDVHFNDLSGVLAEVKNVGWTE